MGVHVAPHAAAHCRQQRATAFGVRTHATKSDANWKASGGIFWHAEVGLRSARWWRSMTCRTQLRDALKSCARDRSGAVSGSEQAAGRDCMGQRRCGRTTGHRSNRSALLATHVERDAERGGDIAPGVLDPAHRDLRCHARPLAKASNGARGSVSAARTPTRGPQARSTRRYPPRGHTCAHRGSAQSRPLRQQAAAPPAPARGAAAEGFLASSLQNAACRWRQPT